MTQKQLTKLETRIASLKAQKRIVWIEGISAEVIKGKIAGKECYFVKADSLNENGGSWYYIVRWEQVEWRCSCEATKPCKHERKIAARVNAQFVQPTKAEQAETRKRCGTCGEWKDANAFTQGECNDCHFAEQAQPTEAEQAEAIAISQHLQAELVLHQAETYAREIEAQRLADERRVAYVNFYDPQGLYVA